MATPSYQPHQIIHRRSFPDAYLQLSLNHPPYGYIMLRTPLTALFVYRSNIHQPSVHSLFHPISNTAYPVYTPVGSVPGLYYHVRNSLVIDRALEQMGRRYDGRNSDVVNADFEYNPGVADASPGISVPVRPIIDLNMHPSALDLNVLPTEEEDDEEDTDHISMHVLENSHPSLVHYPEEEVAITERTPDPELNSLLSEYDLTYEEYLELEEQMGRVDSRLSEETIMQHMKKTYYTATTTSPSEEPAICVICQGEYEDGEFVGGLRCGHEYHVQCIKKWLQQINNCPICKATAVS